MSEGGKSGSGDEERRAGETLRAAIERTLDATVGPAAGSRERAAELLDEVARRGHEARGELIRRGHEAGAGLARRGQATAGELGRQLEALEGRLASIEELLRRQLGQDREESDHPRRRDQQANPEGEG